MSDDRSDETGEWPSTGLGAADEIEPTYQARPCQGDCGGTAHVIITNHVTAEGLNARGEEMLKGKKMSTTITMALCDRCVLRMYGDMDATGWLDNATEVS